jgi:hypothetical protein
MERPLATVAVMWNSAHVLRGPFPVDRDILQIERDIERLGGGAQTEELLALGHAPETIRLFAEYKRILRVRKGWYAVRWVPPMVLAAWRVRGRLGCVSAARLYGAPVPDDGKIHINLAKNASRLAVPHRDRVFERAYVIHWADDEPIRRMTGSPRRAATLAEALAQVEACSVRMPAGNGNR